MRQIYRCSTCGATKEIIADRHRVGEGGWPPTFPASVPCGWRGCESRAVMSGGACRVVLTSSRACEMGTRGCETRHGR